MVTRVFAAIGCPSSLTHPLRFLEPLVIRAATVPLRSCAVADVDGGTERFVS